MYYPPQLPSILGYGLQLDMHFLEMSIGTLEALVCRTLMGSMLFSWGQGQIVKHVFQDLQELKKSRAISCLGA